MRLRLSFGFGRLRVGLPRLRLGLPRLRLGLNQFVMDRRRVGVDEHTIYFDESPVFYRSAAGSGLTKLYLHGIPTSSDDWLEFLGRTGGIAPDLIGFGRSGKGGHLDYSLPGLARFVERFLDHLDIEEVQLVGHDLGAAVGLVAVLVVGLIPFLRWVTTSYTLTNRRFVLRHGILSRSGPTGHGRSGRSWQRAP